MADLSERELTEFIRLFYGEPGTAAQPNATRYGGLHRDIELNREDVYQSPVAAPPVPGTHPVAVPPETRYRDYTINERIERVLAPFTKNQGSVRAILPDTTRAAQESADNKEAICNTGLVALQRAANSNYQRELAWGQCVEAIAVLHWRPKPLPRVPDALVRESVDDLDDDERGRYEEAEDGRYVETEVSRAARHRRLRAKLGFPWSVRVIDPRNFVWEEDADRNITKAAHIRAVYLPEYRDEIRADGYDLLLTHGRVTGVASLHDLPERGVDESGTPIATEQQREVWIAEVWTAPTLVAGEVVRRGMWYELVSTSTGWKLVRSKPHFHSRVPFAIAPGRTTSSADPAKRYRAVFDDVLRSKRTYERFVQAGLMVAEESLVADEWYEIDAGGASALDDDGQPRVMQRQRDGTVVLPEGWHKQKDRPELTAGYTQMLEHLRGERDRILPPAGTAENLTGTSEAWRIYLEQAQNQPVLDAMATNQAQAFSAMLNDMAYVMSLTEDGAPFGGLDIVMLEEIEAEAGDRKRRSYREIAVSPQEWAEGRLEYDISVILDAHRITRMQLFRELLEAGYITEAEFIEEGLGKPNATEHIEAVRADKFRRMVREQIDIQDAQRLLGTRYVLGAGGQIVGPGGKPATPEDVLQAKGITVPAQPAQPAQVAQPGGVQGMMQGMARPPMPLSPLEVPDSPVPVPGPPAV